MDDSVISTTASGLIQAGELPAGEGPPTNGHVAVPPTPVPPARTRRMPVWALVVGGLAAIVTTFAAGYAINAGDADEVRDDLNAEIGDLEKQLDVVEGTRTATAAALDQCREGVEGASALATTADDLAGDWQTMQGLAAEWAAAPVGSAAEAAIDAKLLELEARMSPKFGALSASADRVSTDSEPCEAS